MFIEFRSFVPVTVSSGTVQQSLKLDSRKANYLFCTGTVEAQGKNPSPPDNFQSKSYR